MAEIDRDHLDLLRALRHHGVQFVVIGGVAAQLHGWEGATLDLDISVDPSVPNAARLDAALKTQITEYRRRWAIDDVAEGIGPAPDDLRQRADRRNLERAIARARRMIARRTRT